MRYPVVIHHEEDCAYGVIVPDLPGCFSAGESVDDAINQAKEAIECHLEGLIIDGQPVPTASDINTHAVNPDYAGGIWALVDVDLSQLGDRARRINITMPERVLAMVDRAARAAGKSRSGFLTDAAVRMLAS